MFAVVPTRRGLIDSHCHLDAQLFNDERAAIVQEAQHAGLVQLLVPATEAATFGATLAMREKYGCWVAFGLHPLYLTRHLDKLDGHLAALEHYVAHYHPVAVGEIGLDFFAPSVDPAYQEALFVEQLRLARRYALPVIVHSRRSLDRVLKYLRQIPVVGGIVHAFNGSDQQAEALLGLGFKLGFGGAMTYTGSLRIRRLAAQLPLSALVLETDAPGMRPSWDTQQPNRPVTLVSLAQQLAVLRNVGYDEIVEATYDNTLHALGLGFA